MAYVSSSIRSRRERPVDGSGDGAFAMYSCTPADAQRSEERVLCERALALTALRRRGAAARTANSACSSGMVRPPFFSSCAAWQKMASQRASSPQARKMRTRAARSATRSLQPTAQAAQPDAARTRTLRPSVCCVSCERARRGAMQRGE
jgi:hypothetical protein